MCAVRLCVGLHALHCRSDSSGDPAWVFTVKDNKSNAATPATAAAGPTPTSSSASAAAAAGAASPRGAGAGGLLQGAKAVADKVKLASGGSDVDFNPTEEKAGAAQGTVKPPLPPPNKPKNDVCVKCAVPPESD